MNYLSKVIHKDKQTKETFWAYIAKGIALAGGGAILILVPKLAGIEIYGHLMLLLAYISLSAIIFGNSINSAVQKELVEGKLSESSYRYFSNGLKIKFALFSIVTVLFLAVIYLFDVSLIKENIKLFMILLFTMSFWGLVVDSFTALHRQFYVAVMYFIEYPVKVGAILYFYYTNSLSIDTLLYSFILGYLFALIFGYITLHVKFKRKPSFNILQIERSTAKILLRRTLYLSLTAGSLILMSKIDTIMISTFLGIEEVGIYNIASEIARNLAIISIPIIQGVYPLFITKNTKLFKATLKKLCIINVIIFIAILIFADIMIDVIYGDGFERVSLTLKILGVFPLVIALQGISQLVLVLRDKTKQIFIFGLIAVVVNILLNLILINTIGLNGAAIATLCSYVLWAALQSSYVKRLDSV